MSAGACASVNGNQASKTGKTGKTGKSGKTGKTGKDGRMDNRANRAWCQAVHRVHNMCISTTLFKLGCVLVHVQL
jgi:hypothetical protein